jgi:hypothetical protein
VVERWELMWGLQQPDNLVRKNKARLNSAVRSSFFAQLNLREDLTARGCALPKGVLIRLPIFETRQLLVVF